MSEEPTTPGEQQPGFRILEDNFPENALYSLYQGKTREQALNEAYGPRGSNWEFVESDDPLYDANQAAGSHEFEAASEATNNLLHGRGYKLDDGTEVTGKVESRVTMRIGRIVVFPEGDAYAAQHSQDSE